MYQFSANVYDTKTIEQTKQTKFTRLHCSYNYSYTVTYCVYISHIFTFLLHILLKLHDKICTDPNNNKIINYYIYYTRTYHFFDQSCSLTSSFLYELKYISYSLCLYSLKFRVDTRKCTTSTNTITLTNTTLTHTHTHI